MIRIENVAVYGWEAAVRGARNPMNSWDKSDSNYGCRLKKGRDNVNWDRHKDGEITFCKDCGWCDSLCDYTDPHNEHQEYIIGKNDHKLIRSLANAGPDHGKFLRMITVSLDITAPLYWWKEFDTYKVGTVANSCSTMHKIHAKEFSLDDFSHEHLGEDVVVNGENLNISLDCLHQIIRVLNTARQWFVETCDKKYWWQLIQLLPSSYNQRRTVLLNYQVLKTMYRARKNHKLDEWRDFCDFICTLPYSELITDG